MDIYIPDVLIEDYERAAQLRMQWKDHRRLVSIQANVLLGLIAVYREARKQHDLQKQAPSEIGALYPSVRVVKFYLTTEERGR